MKACYLFVALILAMPLSASSITVACYDAGVQTVVTDPVTANLTCPPVMNQPQTGYGSGSISGSSITLDIYGPTYNVGDNVSVTADYSVTYSQTSSVTWDFDGESQGITGPLSTWISVGTASFTWTPGYTSNEWTTLVQPGTWEVTLGTAAYDEGKLHVLVTNTSTPVPEPCTLLLLGPALALLRLVRVISLVEPDRG